MRVQFNGRTPAFQAGYVGSIPITRLCDSGVVGNARPCQGRDRGFEPRLSLFKSQELSFLAFLTYDALFSLEQSVPQKLSRYRPESPTSAQMILEIQLILPKMRATRLKLKNPISPQLTAPIIVRVRQKQFKNLFSISHHPFVTIVFLFIVEIIRKSLYKMW